MWQVAKSETWSIWSMIKTVDVASFYASIRSICISQLCLTPQIAVYHVIFIITRSHRGVGGMRGVWRKILVQGILNVIPWHALGSSTPKKSVTNNGFHWDWAAAAPPCRNAGKRGSWILQFWVITHHLATGWYGKASVSVKIGATLKSLIFVKVSQ